MRSGRIAMRSWRRCGRSRARRRDASQGRLQAGQLPILDRSVKKRYSCPMARPKSFDENAVLDQAVELFRARGYEGTSLAELESHLGLGRQSLYNTFGDKQALFIKALDRYRRATGAAMADGLNLPDAGLEAIRDY